MRVNFVCDCCDKIFDHEEITEKQELDELETLTGHRMHGIILQENSNIFASATCDKCRKAIGLDEDDFIFIPQPLIN